MIFFKGGPAVPRPEIIGYPQSSCTRVLRMVCEAKGIDYVLTGAQLGVSGIGADHDLRQAG